MILKNCNSKEFIKRLNGRKIICFGAGSTLMREQYIYAHQIDDLEKNIAFLVDNDRNKQGSFFKYRELDFEVKNPDVLFHIKADKYVILITCGLYVQICEQLKQISNLNDTDCYVYDLICNNPKLNTDKFINVELKKTSYQNWRENFVSQGFKNKHKGEECFIIGNGPSVTINDLEKLKNKTTFAVNRIYKAFNHTLWRPTYYFCADGLVYSLSSKEIQNINFERCFIPIDRALLAGKIYDDNIYYLRNTNYTYSENGVSKYGAKPKFSLNPEDVVYGGYTVLYDVIQMAVYMGFNTIYLYGVDNSYNLELLEDGTIKKNNLEKNYFLSDYEKGLEKSYKNIVSPAYLSTIAFETAKEACEKVGVTIKNATRGGKLEIFERVDFDYILKR